MNTFANRFAITQRYNGEKVFTIHTMYWPGWWWQTISDDMQGFGQEYDAPIPKWWSFDV